MLISPKNSIVVIVLLSSILLLVATVGILLCRKFKQYHSKPYLLASLIFFVQSFGILYILLISIISGQATAPFAEILEPLPLISGFLPLFCILAYIVEIKFPGKLNPRNFLLSISPALAVSVALVLTRPIPIYTLDDLFTETGRPDVVLRLVIVSLYLIYPIVIACTRYGWYRFLVSGKMIFILELIIFLTALVSIPGLLCGYFPAILVNFFLIIALDVLVAHIEFKIRIPVSEPILGHNPSFKRKDHDSVLDIPEIWMNPDMTVNELAKIMGTNHTYLLERIKDMGYSNYNDMINRKRVEYICKELKKGTDANIISLMFEAGFRSRSTASREFKRIAGCTPSEYQESISNTKQPAGVGSGD